jgi:hypothetical protein
MGVEWDVCDRCHGAFNDHQQTNECVDCGSIQCRNCTECQDCEDRRINALCKYCKLVNEIENNYILKLLDDIIENVTEIIDMCKDSCKCGIESDSDT